MHTIYSSRSRKPAYHRRDYVTLWSVIMSHRTVWSVDGKRAGWGTGAATTVCSDRTESFRYYDLILVTRPNSVLWLSSCLLGSSLCKTCQLDPAPTWLVKESRRLLSPFITLLFNKSLVSSVFPSEFKKAVVRPLLEKNGLDATQMRNYTPVSNMSFSFQNVG